MNIAEVDNAISKAAAMMNEGFMRKVDAAEAIRKGNQGKAVNDLSFLEEQAFGRRNSRAQTQPQQQNVTPRQFSNSALQESFSQTPPMSGYNFPGAESMGLTQTGYQPGASLINEQRNYQQQSYVQQPQQVYQTQYQPQVGGIDYSMIKYLVSEAIKENLDVIKQSLLTENAMTGIRMPGGNKIQFLDAKGNVYEGQLVMKKKKQ